MARTVMQYTHEHQEIQRTLKRFIDEEINPHVDLLAQPRSACLGDRDSALG